MPKVEHISLIVTSVSFIRRTAIFTLSGVISLGRPPVRPRACPDQVALKLR